MTATELDSLLRFGAYHMLGAKDADATKADAAIIVSEGEQE